MAGILLLLTRSSRLTLIGCAGFLLGGLMFGPDLDIHSVQFKRWGWFRWIWLPYRGSMKHRSPLSHAPITGTVLRIVYLFAWLGIVVLFSLALINQMFQLGLTWGDIGSAMGRSLHQHQTEWLAFCGGLEGGALSHYVADWFVSTHKRVKTKGWKALKPPAPKSRKRKTSRRR